ncbi:MAG: hypothetical protein E6L09_10170 [Verrucomicrobia bacterium]|nr:MAG: hypothetical protein E6L09_10170 [Verrucomicrobiota bacterium]
MTLFRAIIMTQDEEHGQLGLLDSFHAVWTDAHNTSEELDALGRLKAGEIRIANAHGEGRQLARECELSTHT